MNEFKSASAHLGNLTTFSSAQGTIRYGGIQPGALRKRRKGLLKRFRLVLGPFWSRLFTGFLDKMCKMINIAR